MTFDEIKKIPEKERGLSMLELALSDSEERDLACVAYAELVFRDKYKGTQKEGQSKEDSKVEARGYAPALLLEAAERGYEPAIKRGLEATFYGVSGAMYKVLCKVNYTTAAQFARLNLELDLDSDERAGALFMLASCLKNSTSAENRPQEEIDSLLLQASELSGEFAIKSKVKLAIMKADAGNWADAEKELLPFMNTDVAAASYLVVCYRAHLPDQEKYVKATEACRALCQKKGGKK